MPEIHYDFVPIDGLLFPAWLFTLLALQWLGVKLGRVVGAARQEAFWPVAGYALGCFLWLLALSVTAPWWTALRNAVLR